MSGRFWAPGSTVTLLERGGDPELDLGLAFLWLHRAGATALERAASSPVPDEGTLTAALVGMRAAFAPPVVDVVAKSVGSPHYADLLVRDVADDAEAAALALFRQAVGKGVAAPLALNRVAAVYGVPSTALGRYTALAADPRANPVALTDAADRALLGYVETLAREEMADSGVVSKIETPERRREVMREEKRDAAGRWTGQPMTVADWLAVSDGPGGPDQPVDRRPPTTFGDGPVAPSRLAETARSHRERMAEMQRKARGARRLRAQRLSRQAPPPRPLREEKRRELRERAPITRAQQAQARVSPRVERQMAAQPPDPVTIDQLAGVNLADPAPGRAPARLQVVNQQISIVVTGPQWAALSKQMSRKPDGTPRRANEPMLGRIGWVAGVAGHDPLPSDRFVAQDTPEVRRRVEDLAARIYARPPGYRDDLLIDPRRAKPAGSERDLETLGLVDGPRITENAFGQLEAIQSAIQRMPENRDTAIEQVTTTDGSVIFYDSGLAQEMRLSGESPDVYEIIVKGPILAEAGRDARGDAVYRLDPQQLFTFHDQLSVVYDVDLGVFRKIIEARPIKDGTKQASLTSTDQAVFEREHPRAPAGETHGGWFIATGDGGPPIYVPPVSTGAPGGERPVGMPRREQLAGRARAARAARTSRTIRQRRADTIGVAPGSRSLLDRPALERTPIERQRRHLQEIERVLVGLVDADTGELQFPEGHHVVALPMLRSVGVGRGQNAEDIFAFHWQEEDTRRGAEGAPTLLMAPSREHASWLAANQRSGERAEHAVVSAWMAGQASVRVDEPSVPRGHTGRVFDHWSASIPLTWTEADFPKVMAMVSLAMNMNKDVGQISVLRNPATDRLEFWTNALPAKEVAVLDYGKADPMKVTMLRRAGRSYVNHHAIETNEEGLFSGLRVWRIPVVRYVPEDD